MLTSSRSRNQLTRQALITNMHVLADSRSMGCVLAGGKANVLLHTAFALVRLHVRERAHVRVCAHARPRAQRFGVRTCLIKVRLTLSISSLPRTQQCVRGAALYGPTVTGLTACTPSLRPPSLYTLTTTHRCRHTRTRITKRTTCISPTQVFPAHGRCTMNPPNRTSIRFCQLCTGSGRLANNRFTSTSYCPRQAAAILAPSLTFPLSVTTFDHSRSPPSQPFQLHQPS